MSPARILIPAFLCLALCAVGFSQSSAAPVMNAQPRVAIARSVTPAFDSASAGVPVPDLRIDVPLVLVPVHVTTAIGTPVTTLTREHFRLFEDSVEQKITSFSSEDAPVSVGLLFDLSGSMQDKIDNARAAAFEFLKTANPEDEFFLILFNDRPKLVTPFTRDPAEIRDGLSSARPRGQTALLDAIHLAVAQMKHAAYPRKALVIFSDGGDNHSRNSEREIKEEMLEGDVQVYAMGIFEREGVRLRTKEERGGPRLLADLAEETGGRNFPIRRLDQLSDACSRIGMELRSQYLLGYSPANPERDGKYRRVQVTLNPPADLPQLHVWYRTGYRAPIN